MQVDVVDFPETLIAGLEHRGPERLTFQSSMKFIEWRKEHGIKPDQGSPTSVRMPRSVELLSLSMIALIKASPIHLSPSFLLSSIQSALYKIS